METELQDPDNSWPASLGRVEFSKRELRQMLEHGKDDM